MSAFKAGIFDFSAHTPEGLQHLIGVKLIFLDHLGKY